MGGEGGSMRHGGSNKCLHPKDPWVDREGAKVKEWSAYDSSVLLCLVPL